MAPVTLQPVRPGAAERARVAAFIARLNRDPAHHVGYCDQTTAAMAATLSEIVPPVHVSFVRAASGARTVGTFGFDSDRDVGRAWLFGPFVDHPRPARIADRMFSALHPRLPPWVRELELFYDVRNRTAEAFARRHRFALTNECAILEVDAPALVPPVDLRWKTLSLPPTHHRAVALLHDALFPHTARTGAQMVERQGPRARVLVACDECGVKAYAYASFTPESKEGTIDYLGVAPSDRRTGLGRRLAHGAASWLFARGAVNASLVVDADNQAAKALYYQLGFRLVHTMRGMRRPP